MALACKDWAAIPAPQKRLLLKDNVRASWHARACAGRLSVNRRVVPADPPRPLGPPSADPVAGATKPLKAGEPRRAPPRAPRWPPRERPPCDPHRFFMKPLPLLTALALLIAAMRPAMADDPIFPSGVRIA